MSTISKQRGNRIPLIIFSLGSFLGLLLIANILQWNFDVEKYKKESKVFFIKYKSNSLNSVKSLAYPSSVIINKFQGEINGRLKFFEEYYVLTKKSSTKPIHTEMYALINIKEINMGYDSDNPIILLKVSDNNKVEYFTDIFYDVYEKNVNGYIGYYKKYFGVNIITLLRYSWCISLIWGVSYLFYVYILKENFNLDEFN